MIKQALGNKRKYLRSDRVLSVEFRLVDPQTRRRDHSWRLSMTSDVSKGGVSFYSDGDYRKDDVLEVNIVMSGMITVYDGYARIVRLEKRENAAYSLIAIEFFEKENDVRRIRKKHMVSS